MTQTIPIQRIDDPDARPGRAVIVVLEDNDMIRVPLSRALRRTGYIVLEASILADALELVRQHDGVDLFLSDVYLRDASGAAVVQQVLAACPGTAMFMSGYHHDDLRLLGVLPSGVAFIQKPFNTRTLLHTIRALLDEHAGVR